MEAVHPVDGGVLVSGDLVVPGGPAALGLGHELWVGVEDRFICLIGELAEDVFF